MDFTSRVCMRPSNLAGCIPNSGFEAPSHPSWMACWFVTDQIPVQNHSEVEETIFLDGSLATECCTEFGLATGKRIGIAINT